MMGFAPLNPSYPLLVTRLHCFGARRAYQYLGRNAQLIVQAADHVDRQPTTAVEHLGNPGTSTENALQILAREALLLHPEFDRLDRVGRINRMVRAFISVDQV